MNKFKTLAAAASLLLMTGASARAEVCTVYRNGILVDVYCGAIVPIVEGGISILGTIISVPVRIITGDGDDEEEEFIAQEAPRREYYKPLK